MKNSTKERGIPTLLQNLIELLEAHRPAYKQARTYWRAVGLVLAELLSFGRHTIVQSLLSLRQTAEDWSGWYRLFSRELFEEEELNRILFRETLGTVPREAHMSLGSMGPRFIGAVLRCPAATLPRVASGTDLSAMGSV